jgi:hypothetical protein
MKDLKVGDKVMWRGAFGNDLPKEVKVTYIELTENGSKYGNSIQSIDWNRVNGREVIVDLDNGHWAYGYQLNKILT